MVRRGVAGYAGGVSVLSLVPNFLSSVRLALAAAFPFLPESWRATAIVLSALTDLFDGYIARRFGFTSWQGGLLDGAADKLFVLSALVTLTVGGELSVGAMLLLLCRDVTVTAIFAYIVVLRRWDAIRNMPSRVLGKAATAGIYAFLLTESLQWHSEAAMRATPVLYAAAAGVATAAAIDYLVVFARALRTDRRQKRAGDA